MAKAIKKVSKPTTAKAKPAAKPVKANKKAAKASKALPAKKTAAKTSAPKPQKEGSKRMINDAKLAKLQKMYASKKHSAKSLCEEFGISMATFFNYLKVKV